MNVVQRGWFSSCLGFISCLSLPFTSKSFRDSSLTHAFFFFCNNCGFQLLNEMYMFLWASNLSCILMGNVEHFLLLFHLFTCLSCIWDSSFFSRNCILKFSLRTGSLEMKIPQCLLTLYMFSLPFHPGKFLLLTDSSRLTGLSRYYLNVCRLAFLPWTVCNHSVISFHWRGLSCCPVNILSSSSVFRDSNAVHLEMDFHLSDWLVDWSIDRRGLCTF